MRWHDRLFAVPNCFIQNHDAHLLLIGFADVVLNHVLFFCVKRMLQLSLMPGLGSNHQFEDMRGRLH